MEVNEVFQEGGIINNKNKMKYLLAFIITLFAYSVNAQTVGSVSGRVTDDEGNAIGRATVTMSRQDDGTKLRSVLTGNDGTFMIDSISGGRYRLSITCVGYDEYKKQLRVSGSVDLGTVMMEYSAKMLDEVTVMAGYSTVKPNGSIMVRVKGNPLVKGQTLLGFMRFVRGVEVNGNSVSVGGRPNIKIYLDEQEITQEQMRAIDPSMISQIEVIPSPDASYGLGTGGVIKIHLRDDGGMLGTLTFDGAAGHDGLQRAVAGLNLLYVRGKVRISNLLTGSLYGKTVRTLTQSDVADDVETQTETRSVSRGKGHLMENFALRYSPAYLHRIYVYGGVKLSETETSTNSNDGTDFLHIGNTSKPRYYSAGLQYKFWFRKDSASYFFFRSSYSRERGSEGNNYILNTTGDKAALGYRQDLVLIDPTLHLVLSKNSNFNAGLLYNYLSDRHNDAGTELLGYVPDGRYTNSGSDYGAWVDYNMMIGKKLYLYAALNYHRTETKYRDRLDGRNNIYRWEDGIYPQVFARWNLSKEQNPSPGKDFYIDFSYRYFYSLPNYNYLLPTVTWQRENVYSIGNPDLTQELYHSFYVWLLYHNKWSAYYNFNYDDNLVKVIMHEDADRRGVYYTTPENTGHEILHKLFLQYQTTVFDFWFTSNQIVMRNRRESMPGRQIRQTSFYFSTTNNLTIAKNYGIILSFAASTKNKTLSYESDGSFNVDAEAYMSLLKNKLNINLSYNGMFYNRPKMTIHGDGWTMTRRDRSHYTSISLNVSWNFNLGKKVSDYRDMPSIGGPSREIPTF